MDIRWGVFSAKSERALKLGWLVTAVLVAVYIGLIAPRERERGIASEKAMGLASVAGTGWDPLSLWQQSSILPRLQRSGYFERSSTLQARMVAQTYLSARQGGGGGGGDDADQADRRLIRSASLNLVVKSPAQASERIVHIAENAGGFLETSQVSGDDSAPGASLTIRVPAARFEEVRAQIRQLALSVDSESIEARDVTKQYVDQEARLRNLRAEEQQYLVILRRAANVKDTLEVSGKLNDVRAAIEERQAEFDALSKQVETVAIQVALRAEADAQVLGLRWRPLYQLKIAAREGIEGIGGYVAAMTAFAFCLPTILLWLFTIMAAAAVAWRILSWGARVFFTSRKVNLVSSTGK